MGAYSGQIHKLLERTVQLPPDAAPGPLPNGAIRMYAVSFDLDTDSLKAAYGKPSYNNAYGEIRGAMEAAGFKWQQGSVYFGSKDMTAVQCVLAVQGISKALPWLKASVRDIRMLRIEELNDLMPAL